MLNRWIRYPLFPLLFPISLVYGLVVFIRNKLFDFKFLKSTEFDLPVISVGNITIGGTGKTPHVEYLLRLLTSDFKIAMLSRGYKRKTKGFILSGPVTIPSDIGDEPYQIYSKFSRASIAVDSDRVRGVGQLKLQVKNLQAIVLDDAFQHRYVKPGLSIVLIDYHRPGFKDFLLPFGTLREGISGLRRAEIVIVTKVPENIQTIEESYWRQKLKLLPSQQLYFTRFKYDEPIPVYSSADRKIKIGQLSENHSKILLLTGIANPKPIKDYLTSVGLDFVHLDYSDHHNYTEQDIVNIERKFLQIPHESKTIITTEKDAVKLRAFTNMYPSVADNFYYLPIQVEFLKGQEDDFNKRIVRFVKRGN
jgi:tetraacyldisaccharide 4'-kinase